MLVVKNIKFSLAVCALLVAQPSFAGFSTYSKNWPDDADTVDERITKTEAADQNAGPIITEDTDKDSYAANERISEYKRLYAKFGLTFFTQQARKVQNTSQSSYAGLPVLLTDPSSDNVSWEFGLGTKFEYVRLELEYLYQKKLSYDSSPVFVGTTTNISSTLNTQAIWLDLYYDMEKLNLPYFTPYLGGMAGFIWNQTRTAISGSSTQAAKNHNRLCLGWGVTIGVRIPFWTRWFGYLGYKYVDQGNARWQSNAGTVTLKAYPVMQGVDLGVQYLLG